MKSLYLVVATATVCLVTDLVAQERSALAKNLGEVETRWPGIRLAISKIERIQDNRLLVFVRITASSKSAVSGNLRGIPNPIPTGADPTKVSEEGVRPFSLASTVMIDEQTQQRYEVLAPVAPPGRKYLPGGIANVLLPGEARTLSIQFASPPVPPLIEGREPHKQTVSFLLTGAKGPIARVPLPPPSST
jgi:hypothetical protein